MSPDVAGFAIFQQGLQILAVDGDESSRNLLVAIFQHYGLEITTAGSVNECRALMQQFQPNLLISELILPDGDGFSLLKQVQALASASGAPIPAIALTMCGEEYRSRILAAGFRQYLPKPLKIDQLIATVAEITGILLR